MPHGRPLGSARAVPDSTGVLAEQYGAELLEPGRGVFEGADDRLALWDRECQHPSSSAHGRFRAGSRGRRPFRPVAATCAYAGLRASEALGLRWRDVDLDAGTLTVTGQLGTTGERIPAKTAASAATVPMLPELALELRRHRREQAGRNLALVHRDALVFTTATGKPQNHRNALRAVHAAGNTAKLNGDDRPLVGLHDLRHSFVALALASGSVTLPEAAALARHANPRITAMAYAGLADDGRAKLGEKLAAAFEAVS